MLNNMSLLQFKFTFLVFLLTGCAATTPLEPSADFAPALPPKVEEERTATGSIFQQGGSWDMFGRKRDFNVGDVITVTLSESTQSTKKQAINTSKVSTNDALNAGIASKILPESLRDMKLTGNTVTNAGSGDSSHTASLTGSIATTVVEVLANGNLVIRGEKKLALTEGSETIQVSGIIRSEDIAPNNTVQSKNIANAQIAYRGTGDLAAASRPGWGTRALHKFWPF